MRVCSSGCHVNSCFRVSLYADDILLFSASVYGLQELFSVCDQAMADLSLNFNCAKSFCIAFCQNYYTSISDMKLYYYSYTILYYTIRRSSI